MLLQRQERSEGEPLRADAARRGCRRERGLHVGIPAQQPEHGTGQRVQQRAPLVEHRGRDLVRLMKAAEQERAFGHVPVGARRRLRQDAPGVVRLVAVRQLGDLLAEVRGTGDGRQHRVADQVVDVGGAGGAWKAEPGHLQRRRALRQHRQQRVVGGALQVDQDVDVELADAPSHRLEAQAAQLLEVLGRCDHALAQRAPVVGPGREERHLEGTAVMAFEHLRHELAGRVLVEVGGEVADAQPTVVGAGEPAGQRPVQRLDVQRVVTGHLELFERIVDEHGMRKGAGFEGDAVGRGLHGAAQPRHRVVGLGPAAGFALEKDELAAGGEIAAVEAERHGGAHALGGLGLQPQVLERHAEAKVRERVVHLQRQGGKEDGNRLLVAAAALQGDGERDLVVVVARHVGRQGLQAGDGLLGAAQAEQRVRLERAGQRRARIGLADALRKARRFGGAAGLDQRVRRGQRIGRVAVQVARLLEFGSGQRPLLAPRMRLARLPATMGARACARGARVRGVRKCEGHGAKGRAGRGWTAPARKSHAARVGGRGGAERPK